MNFSEFINVIKMQIEEQLPENVVVSISNVLKTNEVKKIGLSFVEGENELSQTIYMEEYFEQLKEGKDITELSEEVFQLYNQIRRPNIEEIEDIKNYKKMKGKIVYKLINVEANKEILKEIPHEIFLDLAVVYYLLLEIDKDGTATLLIRESQRKTWGITKEELHQEAEKNTREKLPAEFKGMNVVIQELIGEPAMGEEYMYVLTNQIRTFGASVLLYDGVLETIGKEMNTPFFVLPSSVHEVIIVPKKENVNSEALEKMVVEINETQVAPEEVLSNRIYYYEPGNGLTFGI